MEMPQTADHGAAMGGISPADVVGPMKEFFHDLSRFQAEVKHSLQQQNERWTMYQTQQMMMAITMESSTKPN